MKYRLRVAAATAVIVLILIIAAIACLGARYSLSGPDEIQRYFIFQTHQFVFSPLAVHFRMEHWAAILFFAFSGVVTYLVAVYLRWTCLLAASQINFSPTYKSQGFWASMMFGVCDPWGIGAGFVRFVFAAVGSRRYVASLVISLAEAVSSLMAFVFLGLVSFPLLLIAVDGVSEEFTIIAIYFILALVCGGAATALLRPRMLLIALPLPEKYTSSSFYRHCMAELSVLASAPRAFWHAILWSLLAHLSLLPSFVCLYALYSRAAARPFPSETVDMLQPLFASTSAYAQVCFDALLNRSTVPWQELDKSFGEPTGYQLWVYYSTFLLLGLAPMLLGMVISLLLSTKGFKPEVPSQPAVGSPPRG